MDRIPIKSICRHDVDLVDSQESVQAAARRMSSFHIDSLVVLDADRRVLGTITDRDLAVNVVGRARDPGQARVLDVLNDDPPTIYEGATVDRALAVMRTLRVRQIPVVDVDRRLVGIVTLDDVLECLVSEVGSLRAALKLRNDPKDSRGPQCF